MAAADSIKSSGLQEKVAAWRRARADWRRAHGNAAARAVAFARLEATATALEGCLDELKARDVEGGCDAVEETMVAVAADLERLAHSIARGTKGS